MIQQRIKGNIAMIIPDSISEFRKLIEYEHQKEEYIRQINSELLDKGINANKEYSLLLYL